jgi:hypothetical protein
VSKNNLLGGKNTPPIGKNTPFGTKTNKEEQIMKTNQNTFAIIAVLAVTFTLAAFTACPQSDDGGKLGNDPTQVAMPTATPAAGAVASGAQITLATTTTGATIYYTTNGDTPTSSSTEYTTPIAITAPTTIKAIATKSGMTDSEMLTAAYTIVTGDITYTAQADGSESASSTKIDFTFNAAVTGLIANDITISGTPGAATKRDLTGSGTAWSLAITTTTAGAATVSINKSGIETTAKTITLYKTSGGNSELSGTIKIQKGGVDVTAAATGDTLTAVYSGTETVSYQWNKDGNAVSGATAETYTPAEAGSYTVTVSAAGFTGKTSAAVNVTASNPNQAILDANLDFDVRWNEFLTTAQARTKVAELTNGIRAKANALITEVNNATGLDATFKTQLLAKLDTIKTTGEQDTIMNSLGYATDRSTELLTAAVTRIGSVASVDEFIVASYMNTIFKEAIRAKIQHEYIDFTDDYIAVSAKDAAAAAAISETTNADSMISGSKNYLKGMLNTKLGVSEELAGWIMQLCEDTQEASRTFAYYTPASGVANGQFNIIENNEVASAPQEQGVRLAHVNPAMFPTIRKETV